MYNLVRADLYKLFKSKVIKVLIMITTLCAVTMSVMAYLIAQGKLDTGTTGIGFMFSDANVISILGVVAAGVCICGDFENKAIHDAIAAGCSRGTVIISKAITSFCAIAVVLLPYVVAAGIALSMDLRFDMGAVAVGFLHLMVEETGILSASMLLKLLAMMLILVIVYTAQLSICVPLAFIIKRPVFIIALYYGFTIMNVQLMGLRDKSAIFDAIYGYTPYSVDHSLLTLSSGIDDIIKAITVSVVFIALMLAITYSVFRKSEIN